MNDALRTTKDGGLDPVLLARMTGRLGDRQTVAGKADALAAALCEPLCAAVRAAAGVDIAVSRGTVSLGLLGDLEAETGSGVLVSPAGIRDWCARFPIACDTRLAVAFAESLLGGGSAEADAAAERVPTAVERDISILLFEQVLAVLKRLVAPADAVATAGAPVMAAVPESGAEREDIHAVRLTLQVALGRVTAPLMLFLPQTAVMCTEIALPEAQRAKPVPRPPEWAERLSRQVSRSDVKLTAEVRLAPLTLGAVARLAPGDVLPFADERDVEVRLQANGRPIGSCELGRSGNRYMLRLRAAEGFGAELMRDTTR